MSTPRTTLAGTYAEKATAYLSATITDSDGVTPLANADATLATLTLTLYEAGTESVINSCTARSVLNTNGGAVTSAGGLSVRLDAADMACVTSGKYETHIALIEWSWGTSPVKHGKAEVAFVIENLSKVS